MARLRKHTRVLEKYGENLDENLDKLIHNMKQFSYRPLPVRKAYIPKGNGKNERAWNPKF